MILSFHSFAADIASHESWALHLGFLAMSAAALIAVLRLFLPKAAPEWSVRLFGGMTVGALGAYFVSRFASVGTEPLANIFEILLLVSTGLIALGLSAQWRKPQPGLNAVLFPMAVVVGLVALMLADAFGPSAVDEHKREATANPVLILHILLAVIATVHMAFAAVVSGIYLAQDRALSLKQDGSILRTLPSIETMRGYITTAIDIGFVSLTASLVLGFIYVYQYETQSFGDWLSDPVVDTSLILWLVFALVSIGRRVGPLYGKRIVYTVLIGFALVVAFFLFLGLHESGKHSFERKDSSAGSSADESASSDGKEQP